LVVANRVAQAQVIYEAIRREFKDVSLLHSRFTRYDRTAKERNILGALQGKRNEAVRILVATQVVEVSLDISFDTIFTEVAPVDDLLQRFGRVNRYGEHPGGVRVHIARQFESERLRWVYELGRIQQTLDQAPRDSTALTVDCTSDWVRRVYQDGWSERELKRFNSVSTAFQSVLRSLRPLHYHTEGEEEFRGLFQSVEVLPRGLYGVYDEHLRNKHYLLATQLLVPIPLGTLHALNKAGRLQCLKDGVLLADIRYDQELGLLPQEADLDAAII
jgi:CRISPR-associated endonuclease/helicase Cas3